MTEKPIMDRYTEAKGEGDRKEMIRLLTQMARMSGGFEGDAGTSNLSDEDIRDIAKESAS